MNHLKHFDEFEAVLAQYQPSAQAQQTLHETKLVLLTGTSSSGRNTIINRLTQSGDYHFIVSDTTRKPRTNDGVLEQHGREYFFRSEEGMLEDLQNGMFLEAEIIHGQQVSGISIRELEKAQRQHKTAITDIDIGGISNIIRSKPDTIALMVVPPSYDEWQARVQNRGMIPADEWRRRQETACRIFEAALAGTDFQYIITRDVEVSAAQINAIVANGHQPAELQSEGRRITEQLLNDTRASLNSPIPSL